MPPLERGAATYRMFEADAESSPLTAGPAATGEIR